MLSFMSFPRLVRQRMVPQEDEGERGDEGGESGCVESEKSSTVDYVFETLEDGGGVKDGSSLLQPHDGKVFRMVVRLSGMDSLLELDGSRSSGDANDLHNAATCPIAMEDFDKAIVDFLPADSAFVQGQPELCICTLPCRHSFHALSILCHMALSGMRCPVCRCVSAREKLKP